jgi:hypothetical protein
MSYLSLAYGINIALIFKIMDLVIQQATDSKTIAILRDITYIPRIGECITMFINNDYDTFKIEELFYMYNENGQLHEIDVYIDR